MSESNMARSHAGMLQSVQSFARVAVRGNLNPEHLVYRIGGTTNHILWQLGHLVLSFDAYFNPLIGAERRFEKWDALFGPKAEVTASADDYPTVEELLAAHDQVVDTAIAAVEKMSDADLERPFPEDSPVAKFAKNMDAMLHGANFHASYHNGQIALLRRAQGLPTGIGH